MTSVGIMAAGVSISAGPSYTDVLLEPFDTLTNWSGSVGTIVAGRNGNGLQIVSSGGVSRSYTIPTANKSNYITMGFAFQVPSLTNPPYTFSLQSDGATVDQNTMLVNANGSIAVYRGGPVTTIIGTSSAGIITINTWYYIETQVFIDDTAGTGIVRVNGTPVLTYGPLDTRLSGSNPIDTVALRGAWFQSTTTLWDDLYISTGSGAPFKGSIAVTTNVSGPSFTTGVGTAITSSLPVGVGTGMIMMAFVCHSSSTATCTTPAGWTLVQETNPVDYTSYCYTRPYVGGDSAPSFTASVSVNWSVDIYAVKATAVNATAHTEVPALNAITMTVTPTAANSIIVVHVQADVVAPARTWTVDHGTEVMDRMDTEMNRQLVTETLVGGSGVAQSYTSTISGTAQDLGGFILALTP
jgi:hypothetical protein